jgi:ubiquinone/menaquinone biosynthesis C-methylase UbiE
MKIQQLSQLISCIFVCLLMPAAAVCQQDLAEPGEARLNRLQPPDRVIEAIGVEPGMVIGEIGAGRGRYTVHLARKVGESGRIYANDISTSALDYLRACCERNGFGNVEIFVGEIADPKFPPGTLDMAFMISVCHHLAEPIALLKNTAPALKPAATLVIVERDTDKSKTAPNTGTTRDVFLSQVVKVGTNWSGPKRSWSRTLSTFCVCEPCSV